MDYYTNACETEQTALSLLESKHYRHSIYMSCLAVELYFKSKLHLVPHHEHLETSHDVVGLYEALTKRYQPNKDLRRMVTTCRKYFNESRYPYRGDVNAYTAPFAKEFTDFVADVRDFIDNDCVASMEDLEKNMRKVIEGVSYD